MHEEVKVCRHVAVIGVDVAAVGTDVAPVGLGDEVFDAAVTVAVRRSRAAAIRSRASAT